MPIPFPLDDVIARLIRRPELDVLKQAAPEGLSSTRAREVLPRVLEHKWLLSEQLGRDVGLRVAAADYFENFAA
jgi:hypothetical protein